jgi:hypothetical protein
MPTVYLETTIPSYLTALPSRDLIVAAHQQLTHDWWHTARSRFDLFVSEAVLAEIKAGDPIVVQRRLKLVEGLQVLLYTDEVYELASTYGQELGLEGRARGDLPHFAFAVVYEVDYLLTWNCAHIANGTVIRRLFDVNAELGRFTPLIVTPQELLEPLGEE